MCIRDSIEAVRGGGVGQHGAGGVTVVQLVVPVDPASHHPAAGIKEIPFAVDLLPVAGGVGTVCVAVPPEISLLDPLTGAAAVGAGIVEGNLVVGEVLEMGNLPGFHVQRVRSVPAVAVIHAHLEGCLLYTSRCV